MGYLPIQKLIHWLTVALIVIQWWTSAAIYRTHAPNPLGMKPNPVDLFEHKLHIYTGLFIAAMTVPRFAIRWHYGTPSLPADVNALNRKMARAVHIGFYVTLVSLGASGFITSYLWFGMGIVHQLIVKLLYLLAFLHIGGAIIHVASGHADILMRMLPAKWSKKRNSI